MDRAKLTEYINVLGRVRREMTDEHSAKLISVMEEEAALHLTNGIALLAQAETTFRIALLKIRH